MKDGRQQPPMDSVLRDQRLREFAAALGTIPLDLTIEQCRRRKTTKPTVALTAAARRRVAKT